MTDLSDLIPPDRHSWPKVRLHVTATLAAQHVIDLDKEQSHYIASVMRLSTGDSVRVFNGTDGEWRCRLTHASKKNVSLEVIDQLRDQVASPDVWLLFAPIKKAGTDMIIQKATELGVSRLVPVRTRYSESQRINLDRFRSIAVEAAEQSERLDVPEVADLQDLSAALQDWPTDRTLFMADETGGDALIKTPGHTLSSTAAAALIGPEGGFAPEDHTILNKLAATQRISLGPRILRAETAAIVLLAHLTLS